MMSESSFSKKIQGLLKKNNVFFFPIENSAGYSGVPDIYVELKTYRFIELKVHNYKSDTKISKEQISKKLSLSQLKFQQIYKTLSVYDILYICYCSGKSTDYIAMFSLRNEDILYFEFKGKPDYAGLFKKINMV